jgi:hypothetical protein
MGAVSFPAASGGSTVQTSFNPPANVSLRQTITSSGAVTIPSTVSAVFIIAIGGGGGGGGNASGYTKGGGGGGGGGVVVGWVTPFTSVVIGAGGTGGAITPVPKWGSFGGYTQVGRFIMAGGGGGGAEAVSSNAGGGGSANYYNYGTMPGYLGGGAGAASNQTSIVGYGVVLPNPPSRSMSGHEGFSTSISSSSSPNTSTRWNIASGGGAGTQPTLQANTYANIAADGYFTGGGGSTDTNGSGGATSTFPSASATGGNGYLAAGSGYNGGSGGGGGGSAGNNTNTAGGTGGNGCVLIYY